MTKKLKYRNISEIDVSSEQGKAYYRKVCANALVEKTNGDIVLTWFEKTFWEIDLIRILPAVQISQKGRTKIVISTKKNDIAENVLNKKYSIVIGTRLADCETDFDGKGIYIFELCRHLSSFAC